MGKKSDTIAGMKESIVRALRWSERYTKTGLKEKEIHTTHVKRHLQNLHPTA